MTDTEYRIRDKHFGAIRQPFIVATPRAYVADLSRSASATYVRASLLAEVEALRTVLAALGIGEVEAYQRGYSLNGATISELRYRAAQAGRNDLTKTLDGIGPGLDD